MNNQIHFRTARPVWAKGRETEKNLTVGLRCRFTSEITGKILLRIAASSLYRVWCNGRFVAHGPTRGPHGWYRVDEWNLRPYLFAGENLLCIEAVGYNANSFYLLDQRSFVQAELTDNAGKVLAATGIPGQGFEALLPVGRVQKAQRYSFQRPFSEVYRLKATDLDWLRIPTALVTSLELAEQTEKPLLPHHVPLPEFTGRPVSFEGGGRLVRGPMPENPWKDRSLTGIGQQLGGYPEGDLETIPSLELQAITSQAEPTEGMKRMELGANSYRIMDLKINRTGFVALNVTCKEPTTLHLTFDEILRNGDVDFKRLGCVNIITYYLQPGNYHLVSMEPYTLRYLKLNVLDGACTVQDISLHELVCPDAERATFHCSDPTVERIFNAARETFQQNATDIFMDCPSRERAGWLCDSFWTARVALDLTGHTRIERNFYENFLLPGKFAHLPEGMLPMCYPSDHYDGVFIPNWAMWFVVQLEEYKQRGGDAKLIASLEPRVMKLFDYFRKFRTSDGLLEKLESWIFVEWSKANDFVQDVNYPTNMLYAAAMAAAGRLYRKEDMVKEAEKLRETIRTQSYDGEYFVDNAERKDGKLTRTTNRTETCQYYAFFFDVASPKTHSALWKRLRDDFGPKRAETKAYSEIHAANAFIGNYLRIELLSRYGEAKRILDDSCGFFAYMAEKTGTLWENVGDYASCNHGFASHAAHMLLRDILGIAEVNRTRKSIQIHIPDLPMTWCEGQIPLPEGIFHLRWEKDTTGKLRTRWTAPEGWTVRDRS